MEDMDEKNKRMQLERANNKKLCDKVQELVVGLIYLQQLSMLTFQATLNFPSA